MAKRNERHQEAICSCGHTCSTHPDAGYSLDACGDCGAYTCPDCRVDDAAGRCSSCAAKFYGRGGDGDVMTGAAGDIDTTPGPLAPSMDRQVHCCECGAVLRAGDIVVNVPVWDWCGVNGRVLDYIEIKHQDCGDVALEAEAAVMEAAALADPAIVAAMNLTADEVDDMVAAAEAAQEGGF